MCTRLNPYSSHRHPCGLISSLALAWVLCFALPAFSQSPDAAPPRSHQANAQKASEAYLAGARLLDARQLAGAEKEFLRATSLDPQRPDYSLALNLTREHRIADLIQQSAAARLTNQTGKADSLLAEARAIDPANELVLEHTAAAASQPLAPLNPGTQIHRNQEIVLAPPIQSDPTPGSRNLHLRGDVRQVVTQAAATFGLRVVFDDSVTAQPLRFDLDQVSFPEAMPILLRMARLFSTPLDPKTLLIAKDTQENREKFERQIEETIYIPGSTTEQLNELTNIVKNVFDVSKIVSSPTSGTLLIRAPELTLKSVNYTLADLLDGGSEVMLDIKLISVDRSRTLNNGTNTPTSVGAISVAAEARSIVAANQATVNQAISQGAFVPTGNVAQDIITEAAYLILSGLATDAKLSNLFAIAGHGLTLTGFYLGSGATINLALNSSEARALDDLNVRLGDGQTTTLKIGTRYPITTSTYSSGISSAASSALAGATINGVSASSLLQQYLGSASTATVPQIQYEDLGLTLKAKPYVLKSGLVRLNIDLKIEALTGQSLDNIPVLTSRNFISDIILQDGSTAVMLSDLSSTEAASVSGLPGLANLPGFQDTLADKLRQTNSSELVMLITPRLVRRRPASIASRRIPFLSSVPAEN